MAARILIDTSVIIDYLRGNIGTEIWLKTLAGRAPTVSPVTVHELRRGLVPGYRWERQKDSLVPRDSVLSLPPSTEDWLEAADVIRFRFGKTRSKTELSILVHDVLIGFAARRINAELWSRDQDFKVICDEIGVSLLNH
jgi:predicted nucleic acid-binding protein